MTGLYKSRGAAVEALVGAVYSREVSARIRDQVWPPN